tara:strand:- start:47297 stop:48298 length:1002 start_codon:yes stop_codon:yes gene_type:complete
MNKLFIFFFALFLSINSFSGEAGSIIKMKGSVTLKDVLLQVKDIVQEGDVIKTGDNSFVQIKMNDLTVVSLGSNSTFDIAKYAPKGSERKNVLNLLRGQLRINILKKATGKETIDIKTGLISLGVRGTEIITSSYTSANAPASDVFLTKGLVKVSGPGFNSFQLKPGQFFNSQDLFKNGLKAIKKANEKVLKSLKESNDFLPKLQSPSGVLKPLATSLGIITGVSAVANTVKNAFVPELDPNLAKQKTIIAKEDEKAAKKETFDPTKTKVTGVKNFSYDLKKEPWEIRDAVINYERNKADNKCWFFFYKKLPGSGEEELFRRERDCDEFEYDL